MGSRFRDGRIEKIAGQVSWKEAGMEMDLT